MNSAVIQASFVPEGDSELQNFRVHIQEVCKDEAT